MLGRRAAAAARLCASRGSEVLRNWRRFTRMLIRLTASPYQNLSVNRRGPEVHPELMSEIRALAASAAGGKLEAFTYDPGPLGDEQVEIEVHYCGLCHSDLLMLHDEVHLTRFPF